MTGTRGIGQGAAAASAALGAVAPARAGADTLTPVTLPVVGGYSKSLEIPGLAIPSAGTVTLSVNAPALAELGRAGADLAVPSIRFARKSFGYNTAVSLRGEQLDGPPIAPELGRLVFKLQTINLEFHPTQRRNYPSQLSFPEIAVCAIWTRQI